MNSEKQKESLKDWFNFSPEKRQKILEGIEKEARETDYKEILDDIWSEIESDLKKAIDGELKFDEEYRKSEDNINELRYVFEESGTILENEYGHPVLESAIQFFNDNPEKTDIKDLEYFLLTESDTYDSGIYINNNPESYEVIDLASFILGETEIQVDIKEFLYRNRIPEWIIGFPQFIDFCKTNFFHFQNINDSCYLYNNLSMDRIGIEIEPEKLIEFCKEYAKEREIDFSG